MKKDRHGRMSHYDKLKMEIEIQKSLSHPNIVGFVRHFRGKHQIHLWLHLRLCLIPYHHLLVVVVVALIDENNVYMLLELCPNSTLLDLVRRRNRLTEMETMFYMKDLVATVSYLHEQKVIHRGNYCFTSPLIGV
jgi:serine/threonine protein kinase